MIPIITIARQYGSGGHEIGRIVANMLNIPFYDKALIALAAKKSGYSEEVFESVDEKATSSLLYSMVMGNFVYGGRTNTMNDLPINDRLFMIQAEIIKRAAREGPCVIIGRCADYILRDHQDLLRVFIHADKAMRVERLLQAGDVEEKKASDTITKKDKQRANYYNFYTDNRWDDMQNYDLTIQTSSFGIHQAADLIVYTSKCLANGRGSLI